MHHPTDDDDRRADRDGLSLRRDVLQLRRPLPLDASSSIPTRPFTVGSTDEGEWLRVNNRSFATHPDQSAMTPARLHAQIDEPWFEADGFLLHDRDDRLAGFCWTKRHPASLSEPAMGEIYVVGVDPDFQGLGLGRDLVLAGLDRLARTGETIGMLYADATNTPALRLYESLGFTVHHVDRIYESPA